MRCTHRARNWVATYFEKIDSNLAGRNLPSVSYVDVSDPCLARWTCLMLIGKSGCGIHDSEVNQEKEGEMMLYGWPTESVAGFKASDFLR